MEKIKIKTIKERGEKMEQMKRNYERLSKEELEKRLKELKVELMRNRQVVSKAGAFPQKDTPTKNVNKIKKDIARINTELGKRK